jgi:membrane protein insertase Oxa1/YidC/SpoIIIJ
MRSNALAAHRPSVCAVLDTLSMATNNRNRKRQLPKIVAHMRHFSSTNVSRAGPVYPDTSLTTSTMDGSGSWAGWMHAVDFFHSTGGLPWWGAIVAMSLALRLATMPYYFRAVSEPEALGNCNVLVAPCFVEYHT